MASLLHPPIFQLMVNHFNRLLLTSHCGSSMEIFILEPDIIRIRVLPDSIAQNNQTWSVAPGLDDVPVTGRDKSDCTGFQLPGFTLDQTSQYIKLETDRIQLVITLLGGHCSWSISDGGQWCPVLTDRPTQPYNFGWWDHRAYHYTVRKEDEMILGLGERAGPLDRSGGRFSMVNMDVLGYSAKTSDPLYKHIPFYITWSPKTKLGYGLFYDTLSDCTFDMGCQLDNYHGPYRYFVAEHGDLDYYFIASPDSPSQATRRFTWMTGRPALMPKWALGYSGSTMTYTDAPDAQQRMMEFVEKCEQHDILCDSFHLSSGYTSINGKRYVFNWNHDKFPDIHAFVKAYRDHGIRLCANIKPCLLRDHPLFTEAHQKGLLICTSTGDPAWVQFWDEVGAYVDFTQPAAYNWWKDNVKSALLDYGIQSTWNDNNEFEIWSPKAMAYGFGRPFPAMRAKIVQTTLMMKASREAQSEHDPTHRPFLVSRSGGAGVQRYAQTWSGDNYTSWETLRYNSKMGLGLALSGVSNMGHDIGGFAGPAPDPELFLRWVQFGVFLPRFSIHSWNDNGTVNEPWMYPEITQEIATLIKLRYRLLPYIYHLLWTYTTHYEPVITPTLAQFPHDTKCVQECDDFMLGPAMLVAPVVQPGRVDRTVYLPSGTRWGSYWTGRAYQGATTVTLPVPDTQPVMLIREGHVLGLNVAEQHFGQRGNERGFVVVPRENDGKAYGECVEDDGETEAWRNGEYGVWKVSTERDQSGLSIGIEWEGKMKRPMNTVRVMVPGTEKGRVLVKEGRIEKDSNTGAWREIQVVLNDS